ncbi:MAG: UvrD-helicase domain-containing protein [Clostridiaceae bacterium]
MEKKKLEQVIGIIREETIKCIVKRKSISENIVRYRKEAVEEFKDDEDKIAEYFDHERFISEEAFKVIDRKFRELNILIEAPYFAKVVFKETDGEEYIYIGRFGLSRESDAEPIIVDWRAPIASIFYSGKLGPLSYNAPMGEIKLEVLKKRQFIIKQGNMEGMFDSSSEIKDEILQMVLSKNAGDKLKDIIMTIQEEQDRLIRYDRSKTIVIDGVAGSGKTTIALHRVAYLLYNYRNILQDKVLIIGPNNIFMDYISTVLPSLGEIGIRQATFREFALNIINPQGIVSFKDSMERIISGDKVYIDDCRYKESEEYAGDMDNLIADMEINYFDIQDLRYYDRIILSSYDIREMFEKHYKDMPLFRRSKKIRRIAFSKIKDERFRLVCDINKKYKERIESLSGTELEIEGNNLEFERRLEIRDIVREGMNVRKRLSWLDSPDILNIYNCFNENRELSFEDLSPILYLAIRLEGLKVKGDIKHIVIDEAQEFSFLQFKVLQELTGCRSFTIVGDINQRMMPFGDEIAMSSLQHILTGCDIENFKLLTSYRSTKQIMEFSNRFLGDESIIPVVREGNDIYEKDFDNISDLGDEIVRKISEYKERGFESIAVICKNISEAKAIGKYLKEKQHITIFDNEDLIYKGKEIIIPVYFAKGLEFDCVINVFIYGEKSEIMDEKKLKYVMATRALHEMCWFQLPVGGIDDVKK